MLSQVSEGEEHPVLYRRRKLTPAERHYATIEREAPAIKWTVEEQSYYLVGCQFTLVTCIPLQWMYKALHMYKGCTKNSNAFYLCRTSLLGYKIEQGHSTGMPTAS